MSINANFKKGTGTVEKSALQINSYGDVGGDGSTLEFIDWSNTQSDVNEIIQRGNSPVFVSSQNSNVKYYYLTANYPSNAVFTNIDIAVQSDNTSVLTVSQVSVNGTNWTSRTWQKSNN